MDNLNLAVLLHASDLQRGRRRNGTWKKCCGKSFLDENFLEI
jgi:hypothetical protein